jgi:hypothetical protein
MLVVCNNSAKCRRFVCPHMFKHEEYVWKDKNGTEKSCLSVAWRCCQSRKLRYYEIRCVIVPSKQSIARRTPIRRLQSKSSCTIRRIRVSLENEQGVVR